MICAVHYEFSACPYIGEAISYASKPIWKSQVKEYEKCPQCQNERKTLMAVNEYVPVIEVQIQDTTKVNNIEQLSL